MIIYLTAIGTGFIYRGSLTFLAVHLERELGLSLFGWDAESLAGATASLALLAGVLGLASGGWLSDRVPVERAILPYALLTPLFLAAMGVSARVVLLLAAGGFAICSWAQQPIMNGLITDYGPEGAAAAPSASRSRSSSASGRPRVPSPGSSASAGTRTRPSSPSRRAAASSPCCSSRSVGRPAQVARARGGAARARRRSRPLVPGDHVGVEQLAASSPWPSSVTRSCPRLARSAFEWRFRSPSQAVGRRARRE